MILDSTKYTVRPFPMSFGLWSHPYQAINRLDRLTSGLMIIPLNTDLARSLSTEFINGSVRKEYIARCTGEFPA